MEELFDVKIYKQIDYHLFLENIILLIHKLKTAIRTANLSLYNVIGQGDSLDKGIT